MKIYIKRLGDEPIEEFDVSPQDTIESLMYQVQGRIGMPPDQQRIIFAGKQLETGRTFADYGVQLESTLHLV